jgi:hypothetical protein
VLSGGAPVAGHGGQRWHDARRSRGGEWVEEEERKEELLRWCAPLKAARGGGRWRRGGRNSGRETAAAKPWAWARWQPPLSKGGRRGLGAVRAVRLTLGANAVLYFPRIIQTGSNLKIENWCLTCSKNSQFLHVAGLGYYKHFSQLCQYPISNINRAKNPGSDSIFESLMNFKRDLNLPEKSGKFSKILSRLGLHKSEFTWDHLYARI